MDETIKDAKAAQRYTMTQLCKEFGVTPRALRFYEQRKLLAPLRGGEKRTFTYRDRARLQLVLRGKQFGFTLTEIKEMLDLYEPHGDNSKQLKVVLPKLNEQLRILENERLDLEKAITGLEQTRDQVIELLDQ